MDKVIDPLTNFILPGGHVLVSYCHLSRVVCRRVERNVVTLSEIEPVSEDILAFLNRFSDYLFTLGRYIAKIENIPEIIWKAN